MGRRKKEIAKGDISTVLVTAQVSGGNAPSVVKDGGMGHHGTTNIDPERAEIIAQYEKERSQPAEPANETNETPDAESEGEDVSITESASASSPPAAVIEQDTLQSATHAVKEGEQEKDSVVSADMEKQLAKGDVFTDAKEPNEPKTVRLEALHEEREKRKAISARNRELEGRIKELEKQVLPAPKVAVTDDDEFLTPEEIRIAALEKKLNALESKEIEKESHVEKETFNKTLSDVDKALSDEGFPGFMFLSGRVGDELTKLVNEDPDNAYLNAPDGWKKIYREKVFPTVRGIFSDVAKKTVMDGKIVAKTGVALSGSHGQAPSTPKKGGADNDGWTYDQYLEHRRNHSL